jgi:diketogulonate reductase-like aldo/keto reductase
VCSEEMADAAIKLNSGHSMPVLGLGVWRADPGVLHNVVLQALKLGYRHFDCAADYKNEKELGVALAEGIAQGLVKREELFITTKVKSFILVFTISQIGLHIQQDNTNC